jgi:hypothetical protein
MCVSCVDKKKKVRWAIRRRMQKKTSANKIFPKGSPYCVLELDEMIMKSSCLVTSEKYSGDGHA